MEGKLTRNVRFWVDIYAKYSIQQGVLHDAKYVDRVYEVIDLRRAGGGGQSPGVRAAKRRYRELLLSVHRKKDDPASLSGEEKRIYDLFADIPDPNRYLNAAHRKRLHFQQGMRERFKESIEESGKYLPLMEEVFKRHGLPSELTRLPFVESSFNLRARSKTGASGVWQFMPGTARLFLAVDDSVDERNDPIRSTEAAAQLLAMNYESLGTWPLAVTAYNHGRKGMMRAVRRVGSDDFEQLVESYKARNFGFASSNYFTELLAAIEVERDAEKYFGPIRRAPAVRFFEVEIPHFISFKELSRFLKLDRNRVRELNPGLAPEIFAGSSLIPAGYRLRLPPDPKLSPDSAARVFLAGYNQIPRMFKRSGPRRTVRRVTFDKKRRNRL